MNKEQLNNILKSPYQREDWLIVLKEIFGVKRLFEKPQPIPLVNTEKAKAAYELGNFDTADDRLVGIYEVEVAPDVWLGQNKKSLRDSLKNIYKEEVDGALIVFVPQNEKSKKRNIGKWRFSYVSEIRVLNEHGELVKKSTEPKRFTYLFGEGESCRTATDRFIKLENKPIQLIDLYDAFSVEKLNKDFFKTYKEYYEKFWIYLSKQDEYYKLLIDTKQTEKDKKEKPIRDFVKKLLGRIVFLQFLQKKEWMGVPAFEVEWKDGDKQYIQSLFKKVSDKDKFHSKYLRALFFETLNTKRIDDLAPNELQVDGAIKIPYLNGGLFDKDISFENKIDFPEDYFAALLDFFEHYNFTIDENDPYESEVGIDPEMLGHIFENLLEENKDRGAFYTPKEIVHYMCQNTLIEYLSTHLREIEKSEIELLVRSNRVTEKLTKQDKAKEVVRLLKKVKICDPAIGSGAFPMGLLKEIYECRRLIYPYLKSSESFIPAIIKKEIIQDNIYGVDLDPGAVDIARLRFWLALVVDEKIPQPLPNLDYKIMQGNSLLERFEEIPLKFEKAKFEVKLVKEVDLFGKVLNPQISITEFLQTKQHTKEFDINELENIYFNTNSPDEKQEIREKIESFERQFITEQLLDQEKNVQEILTSKKKDLEKDLSEASSESLKKSILKSRKAKLIDDLEKKLLNIGEAKKRLVEIKPNNKPYYLWHLYFMDVFDEGGFDIVIGNPPYIQLQSMGKDCDDLEKADYKTFARTGDIYCLFYELGNALLKQSGTLAYITSNKWMNAAYGKSFRKYLLEHTNPNLLIDFSKAVIFPSAVVFVNILQFKKEKYNGSIWGVKAQQDYQIGKTELANYVNDNGVILEEMNEDNWSVAEKQDFLITKQIKNIGLPLKDWDVQFYAGIKTAFNPGFHIDEDTKRELIKEDPNSSEIIKKLLRGKDIKRWAYEYDNIYMINSHNGVREKEIPRIDVENDYPAIYKHFLQYYDKNSPKAVKLPDGSYQTMKDRADQGDHWTNLRNCAFIEEFDKEKIVWIEISDKANYCLDTKGHYLTNSAYFLTGKNLKYLLGVLNSKIMDFYLFQNTAQIAGGRKRYTKQYVELLPIPQIGEKQMRPFETLVDYLIFLNDPNKPPVNPYTDNLSIAPVFEDVLNMCVYELYFSEHMKENEIDVLQFIDLKKLFKDISNLDTKQSQSIIGDAYSILQQQDNPIRNRVILSNIRSKDIIRRINSTTH